MSLKFLLISLAALVAVLLGGVLFLGGSGKDIPPATPPAEAVVEKPPREVEKNEAPSASSASAQPAATSAVAEASVQELSEKTTLLLSLSEASASGTDDGVKFVKPYLLSPDLEVRRAAVEAMKQLSLPSAAKALREAADRSNSPNDKAEFMKAAEFVELPPYIPRSQRPPPQ
jgi:hypothetical protein